MRVKRAEEEEEAVAGHTKLRWILVLLACYHCHWQTPQLLGRHKAGRRRLQAIPPSRSCATDGVVVAAAAATQDPIQCEIENYRKKTSAQRIASSGKSDQSRPGTRESGANPAPATSFPQLAERVAATEEEERKALCCLSGGLAMKEHESPIAECHS